jgi:hypothetical protein
VARIQHAAIRDSGDDLLALRFGFGITSRSRSMAPPGSRSSRAAPQACASWRRAGAGGRGSGPRVSRSTPRNPGRARPGGGGLKQVRQSRAAQAPRVNRERGKNRAGPGAKEAWTFESETTPAVAAGRPTSWRGAERVCAGRASSRVWPTSSRANAGWTCTRSSSSSSAAARLSSRHGSWRRSSTRDANVEGCGNG